VVIATSSGGLDSGDANVRFETARSLLDGRGGALPPGIGGVPGRGKHEFQYYNLAQPMVFAALLGPLRALHVPKADTVAKFAYSVGVLALVFAITGALLLRLAGRFGNRWTFGVVALLVGTPLLHYSRIGQEENILALCYSALLIGAAEVWQERRGGWLLVGLGSAFAITTRVASLPTVAVVWLMLSCDWESDLQSKARRPRALGVALLPIFALVATAAWNWWRFGSVLETGYAAGFRRLGVPVFDVAGWPGHLLALLVSPARGLLVYAPLLLLLPLSAKKLTGLDPTSRRIAVSGGVLFVVNLLFFSLSGTWDGGFGWGPRYLVAPLVFLGPLVWLLPWESKLTQFVLVVSVLLQALSVVLPTAAEDHWAAVRRGEGETCTVWSVPCSGVWARPGLAARALANAATNRPLMTLDEGAAVSSRTAVNSSDYLAPSWWPVRIAYRMHGWSPRQGLGLSLAILIVAVFIAARAVRQVAPTATSAPTAPTATTAG
jgi:hypothetical protein